MAGDFGDLFVGLIQQFAPISGGYGVGHILVVQHLIKPPDAFLWIGRGGEDGGANDLFPIKQRALGGGGAGVDS